MQLFDRSRRRISLTTAGQLLLEHARTLLATELRIRTLMQRVREGALGTLRAGVPPETSAVTLQALLRRMGEQAPGIQVDLHELTSAEQLRLLAEARLDVGLVHHPVEADDLRLGPVVDVPLGVVLPRDSPLARRREIALADLAGSDLILFPRATAPGWHDHILEVCNKHGFPPRRIRQARNSEFLLDLVLAGQGVAFEQEAIVSREPRLAWRPLTSHPLRKKTSAAWPHRLTHSAAPTFAEAAAEILSGAEQATPALATHDTPRPWSVVYTTRAGH